METCKGENCESLNGSQHSVECIKAHNKCYEAVVSNGLRLAMRYKHDCDKCKPLGIFADFDLYFCGDSLIPTVIARYGDDGPEYNSGLGAGTFPLKIAQAMAIELGYMEDSL